MGGGIIEWSTDGGATWHYGRGIEEWVLNEPATLHSQRAIVRAERADGGRGVRTRVIRDAA